METIELFSAMVCPFAHRSRLALAEKGLPFKLIEIDLRNKPDWYAEVNPVGAVPALRQGIFLLQESLIINEYINEVSDEPPLLPTGAQLRAEARLWIAFADTRLIPPFYRLLKAQNDDDCSSASEALLAALARLDKELQRRKQNGPYWGGTEIGLTDIAIYPWFERWPVLQHYRGVSIPAELKSLRRWIEAMQSRDVVRKNEQPAEFYIGEYVDYASGKK